MKKSTPFIKLADVMKSVLTDRGYLNPCLEAEVAHKWPEIVGQKLAQVTECTRTEDQILYVHVINSAWRQEITFLKGEILQKIRAQTRCKTIKDIVFY
jgi:predicted nucleic acid-binding Zn ribbon protein